MSDAIKPALSPEEWAFCEKNTSGFVEWLVDKASREVAGRATPIPEPRGHMLAALALHDQPFGFTWEDVDALRSETYQLAERLAQGHFWSQLQAPRADFWSQLQSGPSSNLGAQLDGTALRLRTLRSLADRIAALLPPRE